jgi:hypothetical protein
MSTNPSTLFLALFLAMASNLSALAQIHVESMKLFVQDMNGQLINVYDIRTESLIKSMNIGDKITRTQFSADQSAFYALGVQSLSIIDVSSLEIKTIRLFSDDEAYRYIDGNPNRFQKVFPLGISDSGIAVYLNGKSYIVFDAHQGGKKVNTYTSDSGTGCHLQGNLYIAGQDGIVRVIDPLSGAEKDRLSSVFEAKALSEARQNSTYDDKHINLNLNPSENFLISTVYLGSSDGSSWQGIYDPIAREIVYSERVPQFEYLKRLPMSGMSSHRLFTRSEQLDPNAKLPEYPTMPAKPRL